MDELRSDWNQEQENKSEEQIKDTSTNFTESSPNMDPMNDNSRFIHSEYQMNHYTQNNQNRNDSNSYANWYNNYQQRRNPEQYYAYQREDSNVTMNKTPKKKHKFLKAIGIIAAVMALAVVFQATLITAEPILRDILQITKQTEEQKINYVLPFAEVNSQGQASSMSIVADVAKEVSPSIVSITVTVSQRDFFNNIVESEGSGSGIIFTQDDEYIYILTNHHVISDSSRVKVAFNDGKTYDASIKGSDSEADLAVIVVKLSDVEKETKEQIKIAVFGDSDKIILGEVAIAIGSPLGYHNTVTAGVVSGLGRKIDLTDKTMDLIQTDAAINPGNSGGALINANGEIIGINTIKFATTEVEGMGFAIPINVAKNVIEEILNRVPQAFLGIRGQDVTQAVWEAYGMPIGVYIVESVYNSPAHEAGIEKGDIIYKLNGLDVENMEDVQGILATLKPGDKVEVELYRRTQGEYKEQELSVTLGTKTE